MFVIGANRSTNPGGELVLSPPVSTIRSAVQTARTGCNPPFRLPLAAPSVGPAVANHRASRQTRPSSWAEPGAASRLAMPLSVEPAAASHPAFVRALPSLWAGRGVASRLATPPWAEPAAAIRQE